MKAALLILSLILCLSCGKAFAQDTLQVAPRQLAKSILAKLDYEVSLNDKQKAAMQTLL